MTPAGAGDVAAQLLAGDRRALARAITIVESTRLGDRATAGALLDAVWPAAGGGARIGISGAPGVGKSMFIESFGLHLTGRGRSVAVLAVDPSSSRSGGSILGDKTRMSELARHPEAFIRPSPSRGDLGGVTRRTGEAIVLCEAAGFDTVIVETVGVGQSETAVADIIDTFILLVAAGGGDELQGVKRGIMELADLVVVTKADGDFAAAAGRARADYSHAVQFLRRRHPAWAPVVLAVSAQSGDGIGDVWDAVAAHRAALEAGGGLAALRADQTRRAFWAEIEDELLQRFRAERRHTEVMDDLEAAVVAGRRSPTAAAHDAVVT